MTVRSSSPADSRPPNPRVLKNRLCFRISLRRPPPSRGVDGGTSEGQKASARLKNLPSQQQASSLASPGGPGFPLRRPVCQAVYLRSTAAGIQHGGLKFLVLSRGN